ncbi:MAG: bifunctional glutamate N-acetyltransferase/amino-acid acetyltransferase ArgJ [Gammaproteobacteria bacterium]|nr:bifunctional glutamate N-acetyltransferase/amino-acid acetyltransferase ArgJ [Gammaproteobacteria bacterium]
MAVGLSAIPPLLPVNGIRVGACSAGIYKNQRLDLAVITCENGSKSAAVFTRNAFCAAPVIIARDHIQKTSPSYCLINAGNANAGMGMKGYEDAMRVCHHLSQLAGCPVEAVLPFSTGVIGQPLPVDNICRVLPELIDSVSENAWNDVANAIITTDTLPKGISRQISIANQQTTITGVAKGSGMIRPDMATMLAFIATDADIDRQVLNKMLLESVEQSFHRISVDGDTSTNDACVLIATGKSTAPYIDSFDSDFAVQFRNALTEICVYLAQAIVRDGEGATKFVTINIRGGKTEEECRNVAYAIAHSPLIKTALFASDPNWGRILAAIGRSGIERLDVSKIMIYIDDVCIVENGSRSGKYTESLGKSVMGRDEIILYVDLNRGNATISFWTCDLSYEYVRINAEYRT